MAEGVRARERLRWAEEVAGRVGGLLLEHFRSGVVAERKASGIVTELDRRAEAVIVRELGEAFPDDGLVSEEGAGRRSASGWRWIVDPLDGTTNYVSGLPMFAVSLACLDQAGTALGVVHAPGLGETFSAIRGGGAGGPGGPVASSRAASLRDAVFIANKAYHPPSLLWEVAGGLLARIRAFRVFGCVSLDLALVAAGRADGIVLLPTDPWDVAAGTLLLAEAGAVVADLSGSPPPPGSRTGVLAAAPAIFEEALALLRPGPGTA